MESGVINVTSEVRVTVTLVINASFSWLERPARSILTSHLATCVVLGLLSATAILFNLSLLSAIFFNSSLKKVLLNQLVSYLSVACLIDCSANAPLSMYYMRTNTWLLGPTLCTLNASFLLAVMLLIAWILCFMCLERYFSLYKLCRDKRCSLFCKQGVAIATLFTVFCGIIFPVVLGLIEVRAFPSRYSCSVAMSRHQLYYRIFVIASFAFPVFISVLSLFLAYLKNFQGIKDINCQRIELSYTELFFEESHLWNEWQTSKFVGTIAMLFIFLELPVIVTLLKTSIVPLRPTQVSDMEQQNSTLKVFYPIAQITPSNEKIYFWGKFLFCLAFPLVTLMLRKDIRRKMNVMMSFCKTSSSIPNNKSVESPASPQEDCPDDFLVPQVWRRRRLSSVTSLTSPIIFGKSRKGNLQFMDLTTGIAKWKANYDEVKGNRIEKPFFADVFDDEDELAEFVSFQDLTEEELNSSELCGMPSTSRSASRDAAVQTSQKQLVKQSSEEVCYNILDLKSDYHSRVGRGGVERQKARRLSKSFNCNRATSGNRYVKCKYYMTYPKMSQNPLRDFPPDTTTSDLMRALQVKRSSRSGVTACDLLPRGTEELLDSPVECRDIVSL